MAKGGSNTQQQQQTTTQQPYRTAKPLLDTAMKDALNLYKGDGLVQPNTMSTVVPFSKDSEQGLSSLRNLAQQNMNGKGVSGQYQDVIASGGLNDPQQQAVGQFSKFAEGGGNVDASGFANMAGGGLNTSTMRQDALFGQGQGPSYTESNLADVASGGMLGGGDPYFEDVLNKASEEARFAADRTAAGMGRYGSDEHYGTVADSIGDIQTRARSDQYNRERAAQERANQQLDAQRMAGLGFGLNAANAASGIEQGNRQFQASGIAGQANTEAGNLSRQLGGASQLFNAGQTSFGNLPTAFQNLQAPVSALSSVGSAYDDLAARELNDKLRINQEQQNAPLANIQALLAAAGGAGGYGTSTAQAQVPSQNNGFSNTLGGLLGIASLGNSFGVF